MPLPNTTAFSASLTLSSTYQQLSVLLAANGLPSVVNGSVLDTPVLFHNEDTGITMYIASGYTSAPSGNIGTLLANVAIAFDAGMNLNEVWVKGASGTPSLGVFIGGLGLQNPTLSGISAVTISNNTVAKGDASNNLVDSGIMEDGTNVDFAGLNLIGVSALDVSGLALFEDTVSLSAKVFPTTNDGAPLGDTAHNFSDLFLATGAVINYNNGNATIVHSSGIITVAVGDLRLTTAGTNAASAVSVGGTQTLTNKTLTSPTLTTPAIGVATGTSLAVTGLLTSSSPTAGIGYATGAGGAQTQATDKSTTVVSNTITTAITLNAASLAASTTVSFTFTNSAIAATDTVIVTHQSAGTSAAYNLNAFPGTGSAVISVRNVTLGALAEAIVLRVTVIKAVSA